MNALAELHQEQDLKLNLKFEIEVLCKNLSIDVFVSFSFPKSRPLQQLNLSTGIEAITVPQGPKQNTPP